LAATKSILLKRARRRLALNLAVRGAGNGLLIGMSCALLALGVDRVLATGWPWITFALVAMPGLLLGCGWGLAHVPSIARTAILLDDRLSLADRFGTAAAIESGAVRLSPFAALAQADAERLAHGIDSRQIEPITVPRSASWSAVAGAILVAGVLFVPEVDWTRASDEAPLTPEEAAVVADARNIGAAAIEQLLEAQMRDDGTSVNDFAQARDEAANRLNEIARRFERDAESDRAAAEELSRQLAAATSNADDPAGDVEASGESDALARDARPHRGGPTGRPGQAGGRRRVISG
jgi:hypothetical protein